MKLEAILSPEKKRKMREWASSNGAVVLQCQGAELNQKMYITKSSNQSVMSTKNILTNMKVTGKFYSMTVTKLVSRARKMITRNH